MDHHNTTRLGFGARTRKALAILVSALMAMPSPAVLANPPVPSGHTKTGAYVSANGVPVVNIAAPNAKGISHNKYTRYDVGPNGLVLNNATDPTQSKLAGMLLGNPNLNGRSASIILNEVVAPNRSLLQGFQEVNGPAAELILANPYGITCSGCGFINTPRATLTTGIPEIDGSGALRGFSVRQGDVLITGDGLNAGEVNYFDIVARSIRVEGQINAQTLNLVAGTNSFDYDTRAVSAIAPDGDAPAYAIDSSALGGMYVDRIRLIATEQGVGVRMLGDVAATVDDIEITAAGKIELANRMSAERDVNVRYTGGVQTTSVEIGGAGEAQIYAAGNASIDAGDGGFALAQADVGAGGDLHLRGATLADTGSSTDYRFADGEMTVEVAGQAVFGGATYDSMGGLSVSASSADLGSATLVSRDATAALTVTTAGRLDVHDAMVYSAGNIALTSGGDVDLGTNAEVIAGGSVSLDFAGDSVNRGLIYAEEDVRVRNTGAGAASFVNSGASAYVQAGGTLQIGRNGGAATFSFQQDAGAVAAGSQTVINAHRLDNAGTLQTEELAVADGAAIDNSGDVYILGHAATDLNLGSFANSGVWYAEGDQTVTADTFTNTGVLQAGSASIHANTIETGDAGSLLYTENDLSLRANNVTRLGAGTLYAGGDLTIVTPTLDDHGADGLRMAAGDLTLSVLGNDIELQDGQVYDVGGRLAVETTALRLATGAGARHTYFSSGAETLIYAGEVELGSSAAVGAVVSDGDIRIDAHTIELAGGTNGGSIQAQGSIAATFSKLDVSGAMLANGDISLRGKDGAGNATVDVAGDLMSGGTLSIRGADLLPRAIKIEVADGGRLVGEALDIYADSLGISGTSATAYGLVQGGTGGGTVDVNTMVNAPYAKFIGNVWGDTAPSKTTLKIGSMLFNLGLLYAQGDLEVGGEEAVLVNTETAAISSGYGDLALVARRIENYGTLYAGRDLFATVGTDFYNGTYNNFAGTIATGRHATITVTGANGVFSNEGTIDIGGNGEINAYRFRNNLTHRIETVVQNQRDKQYHPNADSGRYVDYDRQRISGAGGEHHSREFDDTPFYHVTLDGWHMYRDYVNTWEVLEYFDSVSATAPNIAANGTLTIRTNNGENIGGTIYGGNLFLKPYTTGAASFLNQAVTLNKYFYRTYGRSQYECNNANVACLDDLYSYKWLQDQQIWELNDHVPELYYVESIEARGGVLQAAGLFQSEIGSLTQQTTTRTVDPTQRATHGNAVQRDQAGGGVNAPAPSTINPDTLYVGGVNVTLPTSPNGLFVPAQNPNARYLIETNPLYASAENPFLGADYLAQQLGLDPDGLTLRLGDAYYENKLIRDQLIEQTGQALLRTASNVFEQEKMLYDNAVLEAERLNLNFGTALTAEQVAALKHDIVWMVEQEVQGKKVLVPVVYLSSATRASVSAGAILADTAVITGDSFLNQGGTVSAASTLVVKTREDIVNISGTLSGNKVYLASEEGDIVNRTETFRYGNDRDYVTVAGRTGGIYASEDLILSAGRDISIEGGLVYSDGEAALFAGRDINVSSLILESRKTTYENKSTMFSRDIYQATETTQEALVAGVSAKGDTTLAAKGNVELKGAYVGSTEGITTLYSEEGDVNITTLTLKYSKEESRERVGFFADAQAGSASGETSAGGPETIARNDRATINNRESADPDAHKASAFTGLMIEKSSSSTTDTYELGSMVEGKGVQILSGKGSVAIQGSNITAGEEGIWIEAAKDVDITAAYHTSNTTSSSEGIRIGVAAEASPEGAFTGFKIEGGSSDSTGSARIAGTSSLKSDGDITIIAGNKLTNEGTRYDAAKDINIAAAEVENRAARNQTSSMQSADNYEVGLMSGVTTGGIGQSIADIATGQGSQINIASPESQVRITVNAGTSSATENRDDAVVTEMKAGGNINYQVSGKLTDEGTKYTAGQDIRLDVGSYEAKAAYNHLETSSSSTSGGGMLTVGVNAATEVTAAASAHGSNQDDWQRSSTAVVGSMNAGGNVIVRTREDAVFEGTKIDAGKDVVVDAGGNLQFKQANDFLTTRSASQEGSANVSASACADLTCASANVGASARTTEMEETSRTGVAGSINAGGNVVLKSGDDMLFQGTNITSKGDTSLIAGGNIDFQALSSSVTRTSSSDGGGADLGASVGKSMNMLKDGALNVGVSFEQGREEYQADNRQGGGVTAGGKFTIQSGGDTRLEGTQVVASTAEIDVKGNFTMESAQSTEKRDSHLVKGRTEIDLGIDQDGNDGKGSKSFGGSVDLDVGVDNKDNLTNQNAFIRTTGGTTLNVGGDATLAGANIDAGGGVSGEIKGNLVVETRTDRKLEENTNVSIYAGLGTVNTDKGGSTKGMSTGEKIDYYQDRGVDRANQLATTGVFIDASSNKTDSVTIGQQSGISGGQGGVSGLVVGGNATLKGATEETQNVTVRGTTTVSNVETHHKESSVDFELRGTVASALGSDEGKAGQVSGKLFKASGSAKPANDSSTWQSAQPSNKSGARDADQGGVSIGSHRTSADTGGVSIGSHRASAAADPGGARPQQDGPTLTARKPDTDAPKRPRPDTDNVTGATKPASGYGAMPPVTAPERKPVTDTAARPDTTVVARQPAADAAPGARPDADASATPPAHYNSLVSGTTQVRKPGGTDTGAVPPRPDTSVATAPSAPVRQPGADMAPGTTRPDADASGAPPAHYNSLASGTAQLRKPGGTDPVATSLRPDTNVAFAPGASERKPVADATPNLRPDHDGLGQPPSSYNSPMSSAAQVRKPNAEGARPETGAAGRNDAAFTRVATNDAPQPPTRSGGEPDASRPRDAGAPADNVSRREPAARPLGDGTGERQVVASVAPDVTRRQAPTSDDGPRAPEARDAAGPEVPPANHGVSTGDRAAVLASLQPIGTAEDGSRTVYVNPANKLKLISIGSEFVGENTGNSEAHRKYAEWKDAGEIRYLSEPERRARELVVDPESGRLVNKVTGLPFDTGDKPDGAIFVIDASGRIYASAENEMGRFHHSSFTGGEPVALAGHIVVRDGKILHLNNQSGHYRPDGEQLRQGVDLLGRAGADLSSARVVERGPDYVRDLTTGTDLTGTARDIVELMRPDALRAVAQKLGIEELQYQGTVNGREIYFNPNNGLKLTGVSHDYKGEEHGISKGHTTHPDWQGKGGVRYLNDADRAARELAVDPATGLLVNKQTGLPFDTGDKPDGAIFVIDAHGRIYASAENEQGRFHHSSFTGGEPVALAGHIVVRDGKLMHINNLSGHYWPDGDQLKQGYELLQKSGADLSEARVVGYGPGGLHDWTAGKPINDPSVRTFEDAIRPDVIRAMQRDGKLRVVGTADDGRTVYVNPANGLKLKGIGNDYKGEEHGISRGNSLHKDWQRDLAGNPKDGKVKYLTAEEREARELVIVDGRLFYKQTGEPFSTGTKHDGAIFVIDADGRIYASMENEPGRFHHSSFTGGEPVAMAGHMVVQDGWLLHVNNLSGHYRPDREQLDQAVDLLQRNGLNLNYTTIVEVGGEDAQGRIWRDIKTGNRIGLENPMTPDVERAWMMIERARSQAPAEEVRAPDDPLSWNGPAFQGDPANDGFWRLAA